MPISVLMSLYTKEHPHFLRQSLESVFNQTLPADEIILVLDGAISHELQLIVTQFTTKCANLKIIPLTENGGLGRALNEGLKYCSNELVARMDTDDICFPDRFEKQLKYMEEHPEVDICSSWIAEFEVTKDNIKSIKKLPESHNELYRDIQKISN